MNSFVRTRSRMFVSFAVFASLILASTLASAQVLYVSDDGDKKVDKISADGTKTTVASGLTTPYGLAFNSAGNLFLADTFALNIYEFSPSGVRSTFASTDHPFSLAFDAGGNLFSGNIDQGTTIRKFTPAGVETTFATGMFNIEGLAFDANGNLFAGEYGRGNIYKFTPDGTRTTFASALGAVMTLAFDSNGNLFASAIGGVYKFTPGGSQTLFAAGVGGYGLVFDDSNNLFVTGSQSIYKIAPDGTRTTFATGLNHPTYLALAPSIQAQTPEPGSLALLVGVGLSGAGMLRRKRGRK